MLYRWTTQPTNTNDDDDDDDGGADAGDDVAARSTSPVVAVTSVRSATPGFHAVDNVLVI